MTSFVLLSDVDEEAGPTKVVPLGDGGTRPYWPQGGDEDFAGGTGADPGAFAECEVSVTGPAGTLFTYRTDVLHRGSQITGERRARFVLLADYEVWGPRWTGRMGWPMYSLSPHWTEMMERATPTSRELFGFPAIGDPYWNDRTLTEVQCRYPRMDMTPYSPDARVYDLTERRRLGGRRRRKCSPPRSDNSDGRGVPQDPARRRVTARTRRSPADARAWHWGPTDASGSTAMGIRRTARPHLRRQLWPRPRLAAAHDLAQTVVSRLHEDSRASDVSVTDYRFWRVFVGG